jgi:hypothetical protein
VTLADGFVWRLFLETDLHNNDIVDLARREHGKDVFSLPQEPSGTGSVCTTVVPSKKRPEPPAVQLLSVSFTSPGGGTGSLRFHFVRLKTNVNRLL